MEETLAEKLNAHAMNMSDPTTTDEPEGDENQSAKGASPLDGIFDNMNDPNFLMKLLVEGQGFMAAGQACPFCFRLIPTQEEFNHHVATCRNGADEKNSPEVSVRSRESIINSVLESPSSIRDCICPYCLLISSRRDNTRAHIRRSHPNEVIRSFVLNMDATLEEVREFNMSRKGRTVCEMAKGLVRRARVRGNTSPQAVAPPSVTPMITNVTPLTNGAKWPERRNADDDQGSNSNDGTSNEPENSSPEASSTSNGLKKPKLEETVASLSVYSSGPTTTQAPPATSGQPVYGCVLCNGSFSSGMELHKHVVSIHRTFFRCNLCRAEFVQVEHLDVHIRISH